MRFTAIEVWGCEVGAWKRRMGRIAPPCDEVERCGKWVMGAVAEPSAAQGMEGASEEVFPGIGGTKLEQYPAHA